jgi:hypothetical protein
VKAALRPSPAPAAAVRAERHVVSVLRDGKVSDTVFVRDEHGWLERLGK